MSDPVMMAIAVALATKAAEGLSEGGKAAFAALARLVRQKLSTHRSSDTVLASAEAHPSDEVRLHALRAALERAASDDRAFADDLSSLWRSVQAGRSAITEGNITNTVCGAVAGTVVQARDIHGGISFGPERPVHG